MIRFVRKYFLRCIPDLQNEFRVIKQIIIFKNIGTAKKQRLSFWQFQNLLFSYLLKWPAFLRYSSPAWLGTIIDRAMEQTHTVQIITAMGSARVHTYDVSHVADSLTR